MVGSVLGRGAGALIAAAGTRGLQSSAPLQSAAPALADTVQKSTGWLSRIFGQGSNRLTVPLTEPLPGVQEPTYEPPASAPTTQLTTLPSGLKIASENTPVGKPVCPGCFACTSLFMHQRCALLATEALRRSLPVTFHLSACMAYPRRARLRRSASTSTPAASMRAPRTPARRTCSSTWPSGPPSTGACKILRARTAVAGSRNGHSQRVAQRPESSPSLDSPQSLCLTACHDACRWQALLCKAGGISAHSHQRLMTLAPRLCRTHFRFTRELENLGAVARASASREQMAYFIDSAKVLPSCCTWRTASSC